MLLLSTLSYYTTMASHMVSTRAVLATARSSSRSFSVSPHNEFGCLHRLFRQTSLPSFSRRQVMVELLDDVNGLGQICEYPSSNPVSNADIQMIGSL
jgi:hypothetical protein